MQLLLVREPRALVLANATHALVFRPPPPDKESTSVIVEFIPRTELTHSTTSLNARVSGCLGLLRVAGETFLPVITSSTTVGSNARHFPGTIGVEPISRILAVEFYCLTSANFDLNASYAVESSQPSSDYYTDVTSSSASAYSNGSGSGSNTPRGGDALYEHPCASLRKILSSASFYYSGGENAFDLSTRLQARIARSQRKEKDNLDARVDADGEFEAEEEFDSRFLWNSYLVAPLLAFRRSLPRQAREIFDQQAFVVLVIQGYAGVYDLSLGGQPAVLSLISRLSWKRAGTRFNVRGVDDEGNAANFVETETILRTATNCFSYVQTRGSVPLFWEESLSNPLTPKISITRPPEASLPAFVKHFEEMKEHYSAVHAINLLSATNQEAALSDAYSAHLKAAAQVDENLRDSIAITEFDFHARSKIGGIQTVKNQLLQQISNIQDDFGASLIAVGDSGETNLILQQKGIFRTNCKDCLDRTNVVEDILSRFALEDFIRNSAPTWSGTETGLWSSHRTLFAENGDALSKIYVGTGAINTSFTRSGKKSFAGLLSDATKSVGRMYQQQFNDGAKQRAIDTLLGNLTSSETVTVFNPIEDLVRKRLEEKSGEFTHFTQIRIFVGSYNLNGKPPGSESLLPWLFPPSSAEEPNLIVMGFQEIVVLNPQMILATDPEKKKRWEAHILNCLADRPNKKGDYILLRSCQLVGTALIVLVKTDFIHQIRQVEASSIKTGVKGLAGNKGACAIRFLVGDTSFCFITAHLAAGHSAELERDNDFFAIANGLKFSRGKNLNSHENVIWAADTNYRINLSNEQVRTAAASEDIAELLAADQLGMAMRARDVFKGYYEAPITFLPTYKYDNNSNVYDSSEKQRIPAWTDRILFKGKDLDVNRYGRAELMASDHRPVFALFRAKIRAIDETKRANLRKSLRAEIVTTAPKERLDDKLAKLTAGVAPNDIPPPSSDESAWWETENGTIDLDPLPAMRCPAGTNPYDTLSVPTMTSAASSPPPIPRKPTIKNSSASVRRKPVPSIEDTTNHVTGVSDGKPNLPQRPAGLEKLGGPRSSLLDEESEEISANGRGSIGGGSWQVVQPN